MTTLATVTAGAGADTVVNQNNEALSAAAMYGRRAPATAGLTWAYYGGRGFGNTIADGTVALTASTTNYVVASRSSGAVSVATSTTNWNNTTDYYRVRLIVTGAASVTAETDYREFGGGAVSGGGGMSNPMTTAGDIIIGGSSGTPARLPISTNGYVLTLAAGVPVWAAATGGFSNPMTTTGDLIVGGSAGAAGRLAAGTATHVLTSNGAGVAPTWQVVPGGAGLANITETLSTANPNAAINALALAVTGGSTNVDLALISKGTGALLARLPDGTNTGGNKRGTNAVDFQQFGAAATHVASGSYSVLAGGQNNTASGNHSFCAGGLTNISSGLYSSVLGGRSNVASGEFSTAVGDSSTTRGVVGALSHASGTFSAIGDAQGMQYILRRATSSATPEAMGATGLSPTAATGVTLPNNSTFVFSARVAARQGTTGSAGFLVSGVIARGANAAATALIGTPTVTALGASAGASAWAVAALANTTLGSLEIQVTGAASSSIKWVSIVDTTEVVG